MEKDIIQMDLEETLLFVAGRMRSRKNGPSSDAVSSLASVVNSLVKLRAQRPRATGRPPDPTGEDTGYGRAGSYEELEFATEPQTEEDKYQYGERGYYESLL